MAKPFKAIRIDGVINIIGFLGGISKNQPSFVDCSSHVCTTRGVLAGSREQFEAMNECVDANGIRPVVDDKVFNLGDARKAYQYVWEQNHFGKVVVQIDGDGDE